MILAYHMPIQSNTYDMNIAHRREIYIKFNPNGDILSIECYVDADFEGNYKIEICEDPNSITSRSGHVLVMIHIPLLGLVDYIKKLAIVDDIYI